MGDLKAARTCRHKLVKDCTGAINITEIERDDANVCGRMSE
jgi:hypothetical protein